MIFVSNSETLRVRALLRTRVVPRLFLEKFLDSRNTSYYVQNYARGIDKLRRFLLSSKCIQIASDNGGIDICFDFAIGMTIPRLYHGL